MGVSGNTLLTTDSTNDVMDSGGIKVKNRKIFLEGYVELKPTMFKGRPYGRNSVTINGGKGYIAISGGILQTAKANLAQGESANLRFGIHNSNEKFIFVFDEDGEFKITRYESASVRFVNIGAVRELIQAGWEAKRYKATSPEEGVIVVTKEEV